MIGQRAASGAVPGFAVTRRVLVTGGSKGIGRAVAGALADRGWSVTLLARDQRAIACLCGASRQGTPDVDAGRRG